jgi:hypothetical protein
MMDYRVHTNQGVQGNEELILHVSMDKSTLAQFNMGDGKRFAFQYILTIE